MKLLLAALFFALASAVPPDPEAPTGFDNKSNGMVDDATHQADQAKFDEVEQIADGLGPLYNAQSCRECHQNPTSGGTADARAKKSAASRSFMRCLLLWRRAQHRR